MTRAEFGRMIGVLAMMLLLTFVAVGAGAYGRLLWEAFKLGWYL